MVTNVTSLTGNGLKDWLLQRFTAVYFAIYSLFMVGYLLLHRSMSYEQWSHLIGTPWFRIATVLALFSYVIHAWIGIWTITTDYIKCTVVRLFVQFAIVFFLLAQFIWGVMILWGR